VDKPAASKPAAGAPKAAQKPTKPGRQRGAVPEEAAPALKDPKGAPKASVPAAEKARTDFDKAESPAGKLDTGKAPGQSEPTGAETREEATKPTKGVSPTRDAAGRKPRKPQGDA
jgi:hypothetical protein